MIQHDTIRGRRVTIVTDQCPWMRDAMRTQKNKKGGLGFVSAMVDRGK